MKCQNCSDEDSHTKLLATGLRHFGTDSDYQKQMSLPVWEAKEAREATEAAYTATGFYQKQEEISMKTALCNSHCFQLCREISVDNSSERILYLFIFTRRNALRT